VRSDPGCEVSQVRDKPVLVILIDWIGEGLCRQCRRQEMLLGRPVGFPEGTFARIEAVTEDGEDRTDFVREAVERELKRRERAKEKG